MFYLWQTLSEHHKNEDPDVIGDPVAVTIVIFLLCTLEEGGRNHGKKYFLYACGNVENMDDPLIDYDEEMMMNKEYGLLFYSKTRLLR